MLDNALQLARAGFAVFPLAGKNPAIPRDAGGNGFHDATHDEAKLRAWWTSYPHANVGIAIPPGCVVVDVDPRNGGRVEALEALGVPPTMVAASGREDGGRHYWFTVPPELSFGGRLKGLGKGYDVKMGGRGYVVAPGSIHPDTGRPYSWVSVAPTAPAPAWLLEQGWTGERNTTEARIASDLDADERTQSDEAIDRVVALVTPHYVEGQMHNVAKNLAGWLKQRGWTDADIFETVDRLPSINPRNAHDAARAAIAIPKAFGWLELQAIMGEQYAAVLDAGTTNPRREADARGVAAVSAALASVPAPQAAPAAPADSGGILGRMMALRNAGPPIGTGIEPFDQTLRGGLRDEKGVVLGGAPGAGKTSVLRQMGDNICRQGVAVGWFAADEEPVGVDIRRMQAIGISRDEAERPSDETFARVAAAIAPLPFVIYDVAEGWTLETAAADFAAKYPNMRRVFMVDSLQTARTAISATLEYRARIDNVLDTLKILSRHPTTRCAWIATSELARGSYRNEASKDATNDLAAFKESGGIEYAGHALYVLRSIAGCDSTIDVTNPKNRVGIKRDFMLDFNRETTNFKETFDDPRDAERLEQAGKAADAVYQQVRAAAWPGLLVSELTKTGYRSTAARDALRLLEGEGRIVSATGAGKKVYWRSPDLKEPTAHTGAEMTTAMQRVYGTAAQ